MPGASVRHFSPTSRVQAHRLRFLENVKAFYSRASEALPPSLLQYEIRSRINEITRLIRQFDETQFISVLEALLGFQCYLKTLARPELKCFGVSPECRERASLFEQQACGFMTASKALYSQAIEPWCWVSYAPSDDENGYVAIERRPPGSVDSVWNAGPSC